MTLAVRKVTVKSIDEILQAVTTESKEPVFEWFRGVPDEKFALLPSVFRKQMNEGDLYRKFFREAVSLLPSQMRMPDELSAEWFGIMQHFGLPTRCLDWTTSLGTALFFALRNQREPDIDAAVWALDPMSLNRCMTPNRGVYTDMDRVIVRQFEAAMKSSKSPKNPCVLALAPSFRTQREQVQRSCFTIHNSGSAALEIVPNAHKFLLKIEIPASARQILVRHLRLLGIDESTQFPDLEGLARQLRG